MMENKKKVSFLIMALALIMIALIVWFVVSRNKKAALNEQVVDQNGQIVGSDKLINTSTPGNQPRDYRKFDVSKEPKREADAEAVKKIAMSFAERFGSFSNHSNYANIEDLKIFMTKSMSEWAEKYLLDLKKEKAGNGEYYGMITKAVSAQVLSFDPTKGVAEITIMTRRQETQGGSAGAYFDQQLTLNMAKEGGIWKADSASWQK